MIENLSRITFVVSNLQRMTEILETVFGATQVHAGGEKKHSLEKLFTIGDLRIAIVKGKGLSEHAYNHVAFNIRDEDMEIYLERIRSLGLDVMVPRLDAEGEGRSIYFDDADHHLFELHSDALTARSQTRSLLEGAAL